VTAITNPDIVGVYSADAFDGYIWITNSTGGTYGNGSLSLINMTTGAVTDVNDPRIHSPWAISADSKNVWVADEWGGEYMDGAVLKITP
jgi:DNA-binding beta-propeller fold protein YncE